ncbi:uncharacterized protein BDZ83DRAFT_291366 [Colletotrichum acutatum]|uniref:Uncharacterized protein n=1 Tax=Glomerella acutata TaxID=27357 RepID=A0AAD9D1Z3_GLOAC|nr:uncharacterized protein BDZ83DRAFT_291366 [Colletotrichum acutatum]KAK1730973.1 hypothetical protein BDZ83DRAFT_291366 [Colletotrichum acutatum]
MNGASASRTCRPPPPPPPRTPLSPAFRAPLFPPRPVSPVPKWLTCAWPCGLPWMLLSRTPTSCLRACRLVQFLPAIQIPVDIRFPVSYTFFDLSFFSLFLIQQRSLLFDHNPFIHFSWTLEQCSTNYQSYQFILSQKTVSRFIQTTNQRIHPVLSSHREFSELPFHPNSTEPACLKTTSTYQGLLRAPIDNLEPNQASHAVASTFPDQEA